MDDLISRKAAIDALKQQAETMSEWSNRYAEQKKGVLTAVNIVEDLPSAQRWIPCSEQLPKNWSNILISDGDAVMEAIYVDGKFTGTCIYRGGEANVMEVSGVLAWMPLPEPPKEKN